MTRSRLLFAGVVVLFTCFVSVTVLVGYWGRVAQTDQARAGCFRASTRIVATVNAFRAAVAGNRIIANDKFQSLTTRKARGSEADKELKAVAVYITQTDRRDWVHATNAHDRYVIYHGPAGHPFLCRDVYPDATLIP